MLHIHKNMDGTYYIKAELCNGEKAIFTFSGNMQMLDNDEPRTAAGDSDFNVNIPFYNDVIK